MDNTELHYLTYSKDEIWELMMLNYVAAGGDILYPGDEKEMLLCSVLSDIVQVFAGVDNALRMQTLRYAVGDYLDILGEQRGCPRIEATAATASVTISTNTTGYADVLPAGTTMTADGEIFYALKADFPMTGTNMTATVDVEAVNAGNAGNGLLAGTYLQLSIASESVMSIIAATDARGGNEREEDEPYRERIRKHGLASVTTGPARQYEEAAKAVSSKILDARAMSQLEGFVEVYLLLDEETDAGPVLAAVEEALSDEDVRPLTDHVAVSQAEDVLYTLNLLYQVDNSSVVPAITQAVADYQEWQDHTIGRAFNADRLMAAVYQAGATRVAWDDGSIFGDNYAVGYIEIQPWQRCKGTITIAPM